MSEFEGDITAVNIEDELKQSYLDYAMSVIIGRALPDVRDGLKPVHRRCLFAMYQANNSFDRPTIKSARIVGDVIGRYHPHGDSAAYDAIVRMAQPFSMRYPLVEGQGNFGSMDGDGAAHQRYTEVRMQRITRELMADLDKETVNFVDNYDASIQMPDVFPTRFPNLLVNGSNGIAVGMATNIPPHNLTEVVDGCLAALANPEIDVDGLMAYIHGPDFPTGAIVNGRAGIVSAYRTGRGRILVRARCEIETDEKSGKDTIIVTEIPYQLNRARLIERIAELVKEKKVEGITELRDESAADTRIVIELRRGELGEVVLNNLYAQTQLQSVFGINMVALVDGQPKVLNLKELIEAFLQHRREVVIRRTVYLLRRARTQGHIREGYAIALENIDPVIEMIKASSDTAEAREKLMTTVWQSENVVKMLERAGTDAARPDDLPDEYGLKDDGYHLSPEQTQAILQMQLNRLTNLEQDKLITEYDEIITEIQGLVEILEDPDVLQNLIREELEAIKEEYGDTRRTEIVSTQEDLTAADLIPEQEMVVTLSNQGYAKTQPIVDYQAQRRGGRGRSASSVKEEDFIERLLVANSHDTILCFTNRGKVYWLRVFEIPAASRASRGRPMINILPLEADERVNAMLPVSTYDEGQFIFMATGNGTVKKTPLVDFARPRSSGLIAIELEPGNTLVGVAITDGSSDVMLFGSGGKVIRFKESDVRAMGRTARGVRGIKLRPSESVISLIIPNEDAEVLIASDRGYGKRSRISDFSVIGRGGQGMIGMKLGDRNGEVVSAIQVHEGDEAMLISDRGTLVRIRTEEVSQQGRNTQGVRLINLASDEKLVGIGRVQEPDEDAGLDEDGSNDPSTTSTEQEASQEPQAPQEPEEPEASGDDPSGSTDPEAS